MPAHAIIRAGACGFTTTVDVQGDDPQALSMVIASDCPKVRSVAWTVQRMEGIDAYAEMDPSGASPLRRQVAKLPTACCVGCVVPSGILKAMQAGAGMLLPAESRIELSVG